VPLIGAKFPRAPTTYYRIDFALCFALAIHALPLLSKGVLHMPVVALCIWKKKEKEKLLPNCLI
jgi:hypothetical protein